MIFLFKKLYRRYVKFVHTDKGLQRVEKPSVMEGDSPWKPWANSPDSPPF